MLCVLKDGGFAVIVIFKCHTKTVFVQCMEYIIPEAFDCFGPIKFKLHGVEDIVENDEDIADTLLSTITQSRAQSLLMAANLKASKLRITKCH